MRTIFVLDRQDLADLKSGKPFEIQVGNGQIITLQFVVKPVSQPTSTADQPAALKKNGAKPGTPFPEAYPKRLRRRVLKYAESHSAVETARKFKVSPTTIHYWQKKEKK